MRRIRLLLLISVGIGWMMTGCSSGCSNSGEEESFRQLPQSDPLVMIIKNRSDIMGVTAANQLARSFDYTKIPYTTLDLSLLSSKELSIPESVRLVCLTTSDVEQMSDSNAERLVRFIAEGNSMLATSTIWDERFGYMLGIEQDAEYELEPKADGFQFQQLAFPGFENGSFSMSQPFYHRGFTETIFNDSVEVLATSKDSIQAPIILENKVGRGETVFLNSQIGHEKSYRGILFSLVLKLLEGVAYPVANTSTIFLDDFPAPLYNKKMPPIDWEYDITHAQFVTDVWWPDMQKLADKYDIDYSAMLAFNYNANVVPPFDFNEWTLSGNDISGEQTDGSIGLAKDVAESRHELAFHGYNHFSLWLENWPNQEFMVSALQAARKRWRIDGLGALPVTYVPPTNYIDSTGINALTKAIPEIRYMCSLYHGHITEGTGREFSPDPYNPSLFDYPRITSGFVANDNSMFHQHSLYLLTGIWTHFVHPDDVFQVNQRKEDGFSSRNERGLGWHKNSKLDFGLYEVFERRLGETVRNYPFIRFKAAKDAVPIVQDWTQTQNYRKKSGEQRLIVNNANSVQQQRGVTTNPSYWFMYITENKRKQIEEALTDQTQKIVFTRLWGGYLAQFSTNRDTLYVPDLHSQKLQASVKNEASISNTIREYNRYLRPWEYSTPDTTSEEWKDTRLQDALAQLNENPNSKPLQDKTIDLAIEFSRTDLAISLLERRLINNKVWTTGDIKGLIKYYGWTGKSGRAWTLLEKLWEKHKDQSVVTLKDMFVREFGVPTMAFREKWLKRELRLNPTDDQVLRQLVRTKEAQGKWPQAKDYLKKLIQLNPASDTLYHYSLQRSLWNDKPDSTIEWLNSFPRHARDQLDPLSKQIAELYAYSIEDYNKALVWADKSNSVSTQTRLQWLLQADRKEEFRRSAQLKLAQHPRNDSLRTFVGREFIYSGNFEEGVEILYPLFKNNGVSEEVAKLVHTEIGYRPYEKKKKLYHSYPALFTPRMTADLQHQYRTTEGIRGGAIATYESDNFDNTEAMVGLTAQWGHQQKGVHTVTTGRSMVQSDVNANSLSDRLTALNYTFQRSYRQQTMQSTIGAGIKTGMDGEVLPELNTGFWIAGADSTFTSTQLSFNSVMTNTAISRGINQLKGTLYREDYWLKTNQLMTTFSGTAKWYTDKVFSYEALGRLYVQIPFSTSLVRTRLIGETAFLDATTSYTSGIPYWTPDDLFIKGGGVDLRFQDKPENPGFRLETELMGKHNKDGFYITAAARLNARIARYWELVLNGELSSSDVYQSNSLNLTFRYTFPHKLTPAQ